MNHLEKEIQKTISEFLRTSRTENIEDWQGKPTDIQHQSMLVRRNMTLSMHIPNDINQMIDMVKPDLPWAEDHFQERIEGNPTNPGETYKWWPYHSKITKDDTILNEKFSHTYQERFWPKHASDTDNKDHKIGIRFGYGDYMNVVDLLRKNPTTRQAYLPIWFPEDTWAADNSKRVPCTLGYYFYIEDGYLCCNYIIRSCDLYRHFRNDIYMTARLLQHTAELLGIEYHTVTMHVFNLHLFINDKYMFSKKENIKI